MNGFTDSEIALLDEQLLPRPDQHDHWYWVLLIVAAIVIVAVLGWRG